MNLQQSPSEYLQQSLYQKLKYFLSLKGFLKPFKGKGDWELLEQQMTQTREELNEIARHVDHMLRCPPWSLLDTGLRFHKSTSGTAFLRWGTRDFKHMGVLVWDELMNDPKTPTHLLEELCEIEKIRITLNMQVSAVQYLHKQSWQCREKLEHAEQILAEALSQRAESREQRAESREQRAESREQRAGLT